LWNKRIRRTPILMFLITIIINIGMYAERFMITPTSLSEQRVPFFWGDYWPQFTDSGIVIGTFAWFTFLYLVMAKLIPMVPVWEVQEGQMAHTLRKVGKAKIPSVTELE
jgi:molybdopterin-containing oxidoreductase family membrane subunit